MKSRPFNVGVLLVALGASLWGLDAVVRVPLINLGISSIAIVLAEHILLAIYAVPAIILGWSQVRRLRAKQWGAVVLIAFGASALATVLFTEGMKVGDPSTVILLQKSQPIFAIVLARLALGERLPPAFWPCFALAMVGGYLTAFSSLEPLWRLPSASIAAAGYALGAALLWGAGTVLGRFSLGSLNFHTLTGLRFLVALPFLFLLAIPGNGVEQAVAGIVLAPATVAALAFIPGLLGMLIYYRGLSSTPASMATLAELAFPFTAVVVNWIFLGRVPTVTQLIGFSLLWLALLLLTRIDAGKPVLPVSSQPAGAGAGRPA